MATKTIILLGARCAAETRGTQKYMLTWPGSEDTVTVNDTCDKLSGSSGRVTITAERQETIDPIFQKGDCSVDESTRETICTSTWSWEWEPALNHTPAECPPGNGTTVFSLAKGNSRRVVFNGQTKTGTSIT